MSAEVERVKDDASAGLRSLAYEYGDYLSFLLATRYGGDKRALARDLFAALERVRREGSDIAPLM